MPSKLPPGKTSWIDKIFGGKRKTPIDDPIFDGKTISQWIYDLQGDDYESINAVNSLVKADSLAVPQLISNLKNSNTNVRKMIPLILGRMETRVIEAVQALTNSCNDTYPMVAIGARYALIMITGDVDEHLRALCKYLESRDPVSRGAAAHAIGMIGNKALRAARKLFEMRQKETSPVAYQQASNALQRIGWNPAIGAMPDIDFY
jgi:HEAT repeat protein